MEGSRYATVALMNRGDFPLVGIQYNGEEIAWAPRETKHLIQEIALHCLKKSEVRFDPMTRESVKVLAVVKPGEPEPPVLSYDEGHPDQWLDTKNYPDTHFDNEGNPLPRGELKRLAAPTAMMMGRIPGSAGAGVPASHGAAGTGLGAKEPMPPAIAASLRDGIEQLAPGVLGADA